MSNDAKVVITAQDQTAAAFASLKSNLGAAKGSIDSLASNIGNLGGLLAASIGGLSIAGFANMVKGGIESAAAMHDLAIQTGTTVEALSGLASIGKFSGISAETIGASMNKLAKNMAGATEESRGAGKAIEALGLDFNTFKQLDPAGQMQTVAKALDGFQDGAGKSAISMALFGKEGAQLLPMMKDLAVAGDLQAKITGEQAAMADNFSDNLTRVKASSEGWKKELTMGMLPALDTAAQAFVNVMNGTGGVRDEIKKLSADGTLKEWTQSAIIGLTYVMDAGAGVVRTFESLGKGLGALAAMGAAAVSGDFGQVRTIWQEFTADMDKAWTSQTMGQRLRDQIANLNATGAAVKATAAAAEAAKPRLDFTNIMEKNKKAADEFRALWDKIFAKDSGVEADFNKNINILKESLYSGRISLDQYIESVRTYSAQQKYAAEAAKALASNEEAARKWLDANDKTLESLIAGNEKLREQNEVIGLTVEQTNALTLARADAAIAQAELNLVEAQNIEGNEARINQIEREISLLRQRRDLIATGQEKTAAVEAARLAEKAAADASSAWQKYTDQINQSLTDALMNGFTAGKGFAKSFTDSVKAMFNTMVLRPIISAIVTPVGTAATSLLGFSGSAQAAQGGSSLLSSLGNISSWGSAGASILGGFGGAATVAGNAALASTIGITAGEAAAAAAAAGAAGGVSAGAAGMAASLGSTLGPLIAAAPYLAAIAGVYMLAKNLDHSGTPHTGGGSQYSAAGGLLDARSSTFASGFTGIAYSDNTTQMTAGLVQSIVGILDSTASAFGKTAGYTAAASFADDSSKDGAWGSLRIADAVGNALADWQAGGVSFRTFSDGSAGSAEYLAAVSADVRRALDQIDVPDWAKNMLSRLGDAPSLEQITQTVGQITAMQNAIVAQRAGLQQQLDLLSGVTTQREIERAALDESNRSLYDQITALQDKKSAEEEAAQAAQAAAEAMKNAMSGVNDEADRLRGAITASGSRGGLAALQAQFAVLTAQARAGSVDAMRALPGISQALETAAAGASSTATDYARSRAWLASSLSATGGLTGGYGYTTSAGGAVVAAPTTAADLQTAVARLTEEVQGLRIECRTTAVNTGQTNRLLDRVMPDGDALAVRTAA